MDSATFASVVVLSLPFLSMPLGTVTDEAIKQSSKQLLWSHIGDRLESVEEEGVLQWRVRYPKGEWGSKESGAQAQFSIPDSTTATCEYRLRFPPDFDFVKGGKLPGLAGGQSTSGGNRPTGDGWSARYMWRRKGEAVLYLYHLDQKNEHADDFPLGRSFQPGTWHHLKQEVRVNSDDLSNGQIRVWFDGDLVLERNNLRFQLAGKAPVNRFYFSTFFGGDGKLWAPSREQTIDFASIQVTSSELANPK